MACSIAVGQNCFRINLAIVHLSTPGGVTGVEIFMFLKKDNDIRFPSFSL